MTSNPRCWQRKPCTFTLGQARLENVKEQRKKVTPVLVRTSTSTTRSIHQFARVWTKSKKIERCLSHPVSNLVRLEQRPIVSTKRGCYQKKDPGLATTTNRFQPTSAHLWVLSAKDLRLTPWTFIPKQNWTTAFSSRRLTDSVWATLPKTLEFVFFKATMASAKRSFPTTWTTKTIWWTRTCTEFKTKWRVWSRNRLQLSRRERKTLKFWQGRKLALMQHRQDSTSTKSSRDKVSNSRFPDLDNTRRLRRSRDLTQSATAGASRTPLLEKQFSHLKTVASNKKDRQAFTTREARSPPWALDPTSTWKAR